MLTNTKTFVDETIADNLVKFIHNYIKEERFLNRMIKVFPYTFGNHTDYSFYQKLSCSFEGLVISNNISKNSKSASSVA